MKPRVIYRGMAFIEDAHISNSKKELKGLVRRHNRKERRLGKEIEEE